MGERESEDEEREREGGNERIREREKGGGREGVRIKDREKRQNEIQFSKIEISRSPTCHRPQTIR